MEKRLTILTAIGTFVILSLLIVFFIIYSDSSETCTTPECVRLANDILTNIDTSVAPCNDFYEFACGNFLRSVEENESKDLVDLMEATRINEIRQMIEEPITLYDSKSFSETKSFYRACLNESAIDINGLKGIRRILNNIGGWPLLEKGNWRENLFDWKRAIYQLRKIGIDFNLFLHIIIDVDKIDQTRHIIAISHVGTDAFDIVDKDKKLYHDFMVDVASSFGADKNRADRDFKEVIEFQNQLKKVTTGRDPVDIKNADPYNPKTLSQMQYDFPSIPWVDYINGVLYPSATVTSDDLVNVVDPGYITDFLELLHKTPKRIMSNFISWRLIEHHIPYLTTELREKMESYNQKTQMYKRQSRREICLSLIRNKMPYALETAYVKRYINDEGKRTMKDIIDYIRKEFNKIMDDFDWLDADAIEVAKEKLVSIKDYIAHTPDAPSRSNLAQYYDTLKMNGSEFLSNLLEVQLMNVNTKYQKLSEPVFEDEHNDVIYSIKENTFVLPSYYLQGLFFNEDRPQYMNYGSIGTIIAYQLSNLFLDGRRYDLHGNLREWSTSKSLLNYEAKLKCISDQYEEFYIPDIGKNVNSTLTQEDDLATFIGKRVAYEAYRTWSEMHDTEPRLPGLNYTPKQLFWISSAMYECAKYTAADARNEIFKKHRSVPKLRLIGALRNYPAFAKDFNCPGNSYMNPLDKCMAW